jgi:SAM-dependent methyltransferase
MMDKFIEMLRKQGVLKSLLEILRKLGLLTLAFRVYERINVLGIHDKGCRQLQVHTAEGPIPPSDLIVLVAGNSNVEWFLSLGKSMFETLIDILRKNGAVVETMQAVLELGCGCGRVLRYWGAVRGPEIHGTDYNPRLIEWCRRNLPFAHYRINNLYPPLAYADQSFDCIYATSVFTHMSEELQSVWMQELARILKPGGYLLITTHGVSYRERLTAPELEAFDAGKLVVRYEEASGMNLCSAYHPESYVRKQLAAGQSVILSLWVRKRAFTKTYIS